MPEDKKPPEQVEPARKPELGRRSKSWSGRLVSKGVAAVESDFTDSQETIQTAGSIDDDTTPLLAPKKESRAAFRYASPFLRKEKRAVRPSPLTRSITALDTAHIYGGPGDEKPLNEHKSVRFLERSRPVNDEESYWAGSDGHVSRTPAPPPRLLVSPGSGDYRKVLATEFGPGENPPIELTGLSPIQHPADGPGDTRPLPSPVSPPDPDYIAHVERSMAQKTNIYFPPAEREVVEEVDISLLNEEQVYAYRVGKISNWVHFPPRQVSAEFLPKSKAHWDWRPLELRGRDQFTVFSSLELDDGTRAKAVANNNWAATF